MPAVFEPTVTKLTAGGTTASDFLSALQTHFGSSSKFSLGGNDASGFWLSCDKAGEDWELAFHAEAGVIQVAVDPNASFTASDTVSDTSEWSGMHDAASFGTTPNADFYVVELDDALFFLWMNGAKSQLTDAIHAGRIWRPVYWNLAVPHVGFLVNSILTTGWMDFSNAPNRIYVGGTQKWCPLSPGAAPTHRHWVDGARVPIPYIADIEDINGTTDLTNAAVLRYFFGSPNGTQRPIGDFETNGDDTFVYVESNTTSSVDNLIPWDSAVIPDFA